MLGEEQKSYIFLDTYKPSHANAEHQSPDCVIFFTML